MHAHIHTDESDFFMEQLKSLTCQNATRAELCVAQRFNIITVIIITMACTN